MRHRKMVIGLDAGATGGVACLVDYQFMDAMRMPTKKVSGKDITNAAAIWNRISAWAAEYQPDVSVIGIEAVHAMPKQGVSSSFTFGRQFGKAEAALELFGYPMHYITPSVWKKAFHLTSSKQDSIDAAKLRFGDAIEPYLRFKKDDGVAEAALIAAYTAEKFT